MGAGDTGAPKARGFLAEKDQFQRREAAQEAMYIRQQEVEKCVFSPRRWGGSWGLRSRAVLIIGLCRIERLRMKMKESQKHMEELDRHLEELAKTQGGEQN
ncbi:ATPase inhibitor [Penicillium canariense]|uniref:ATPase inhibitor, mitochondrial n=1 Tax=Penicillium canariense TaxID=189055 RepID=A0A9W9HJZ1_9EURO|nr:ATPase inhibitor [Penicillium canariense]KAJ5151293.1 ATPase inhibitor [Penicillium canariense]